MRLRICNSSIGGRNENFMASSRDPAHGCSIDERSEQRSALLTSQDFCGRTLTIRGRTGPDDLVLQQIALIVVPEHSLVASLDVDSVHIVDEHALRHRITCGVEGLE